MTPLEKLLRAEARRLGIGVEVLLKDYAIGHVLGAIAAEPTLSDTLVFKGGTALKKLYFGDYRFSEDLDFTAAGAPSGPALETSLQDVAGKALASLGTRGPFAIVVERQQHRDPHPADQGAFDLRNRYPWQRIPLCVVKVGTTSVIRLALSLLGYNESAREGHCQYHWTRCLSLATSQRARGQVSYPGADLGAQDTPGPGVV